ncbi:hypothetical protein BGZ83_005815 [Gryganskiella cystojenkinii]|nr:hypothetical protein BGZ83_005815 [Gryganskiella cystojenkinii]
MSPVNVVAASTGAEVKVKTINHNRGVNAHPCFVYGSLMDARVRDSVTRSGPDAKIFVAKGSIKGYIRYPYYNQPFPGMIASEDPEATVEGLLIFGLTDQDRYRLDQFEGPEYPRSTLTVKVHEPVPAEWTLLKANDIEQDDYIPETTLQAFVYTFTGPLVHLDRTRPWDYEAFKRDHLSTWMTKSPTFASMVERTTEAMIAVHL